jgi:hypothetical protein
VLRAAGVPACPVAPRSGLLTEPYLVENGFSHVVLDARHGRFRLVRASFRAVRPGPCDVAPDEWPQAMALLDRVGTVHAGYRVVPDPTTVTRPLPHPAALARPDVETT